MANVTWAAPWCAAIGNAMNQLPLISMTQSAENLASQLGGSFQQYGFAMVCDHGLEKGLLARAWDLTAALFAEPAEYKLRYHDPEGAGARGYTPFGVEIAKGAQYHDLKEFWHIGREASKGRPLPPGMQPNIWPDRPDGFIGTFRTLYSAFDSLGTRLLSPIARWLGLSPDWFDDVVSDGNSVLRLLHYPPVSDDAAGAIRAGAHEDINLITLLLGAEEAGLEIRTREGEWIGVNPPHGALVINVGDMLQRLTNHVLPSTTHRVRNPSGERAPHSRYSMPFFLHPRSDFLIETLPGCISPDRPNRYSRPISADAYLTERLRDIGLLPRA